MWVGETLADVINYPIAGLFVVFLANVAADRVLVRRRDLPRVRGAAGDDRRAAARPAGAQRARPRPAARRRRRAAEGRGRGAGEGRRPIDAPASIVADLKAGWAFLRHETVLLANTLQGTAGQFAVGIVTVSQHRPGEGDHERPRATSTAPRTRSWRRRSAWATCVGGFVLGAIAARVRKGPLVIAAYTAFGVLVFLVGIADSIPLVLGLLFGVRRREHGVRHPQPDAVPGAHAAGADGARGEPAVRAGVRRDVRGDGGGRAARRPCSARVP